MTLRELPNVEELKELDDSIHKLRSAGVEFQRLGAILANSLDDLENLIHRLIKLQKE